jgi:hypothetical protein
VFQNKAKVSEHMAAEVKAGFSCASKAPPMIPVCVRPINLIPKMKPVNGAVTIVGWRMVIDASYPGRSMPDNTAVGADGVERYIAPNLNYNRLLEGGYNWSSVGEIGKGVQVLMALAQLCEVALVGKCYDFKSWFRQLPMCLLDRWQVVEAWAGEYYHDARVAMGCSFSADIAQRTPFIILKIVDFKLLAVFPSFLEKQAELGEAWVTPLRDWTRKREELYPNDPNQWKPWSLFSYQDDTPSATLLPIAAWLDESVEATLAELGAPLSGKEKPYATKFEAIGGQFEFKRIGEGILGPGEGTILDFERDVAELKRCYGEGRLVEAGFFESFKGRYEWVGRFLVNGPARTCPAHRCWAQHWRLGSNGVRVSQSLMESVNDTAEDIRNENFARMVRDPKFWHGGLVVSGDASTKDGWGVVSGDVGAGGLWEPATKEAIERSSEKVTKGDRVSISPLGLTTVGLLICLEMETSSASWEGRRNEYGVAQLVLRCDNQSACDVMESRRPKSPAMREALSIVESVEARYGVLVRLEHIKTDENVVADAISHDDWVRAQEVYTQAKMTLKKAPSDLKGPFEDMSLLEFARECERKVCSAISRAGC